MEHRVTCYTENEINQLLKIAHSVTHLGSKAMNNQLRYVERLRILYLLNKCKKFTATYQICKEVDQGRIAYVPLKFAEIEVPMQQVNVDLAEYQTSNRGHNYVLVHIDQFTKFTTLVPLYTKEALEVA